MRMPVTLFCFAMLAACSKRAGTETEQPRKESVNEKAAVAAKPEIPGGEPKTMPKVEVRSAEWYEEAAARGDAAAQAKLGGMYADGSSGVPKDEAKAVEWLRKAAAQGDASALDRLADLFAEGKVVPNDPAEALTLLEKASA